MRDPRVDQLADILVHYSVEVKPGQVVVINGDVGAMALVESVFERVLAAGAHPVIRLTTDNLGETFLREANDAQLEYVSPQDVDLYQAMDAIITMRASANTRAMTNIDPAKASKVQTARRQLQKIVMGRSAQGELNWVGTRFPSEAYAQDADMSFREYEDFVYTATGVLEPAPVAFWQEMKTRQDKLIAWLKGKDKLEVKGPHIDLKLSIKDRTWINACGLRNMPDGEIFTGPIEDSVEGWVKFSYPAVRQGRLVEGVEFTFKEGKVTEATATKNNDYLQAMLDGDAGARYLGEFAIGTNYNITQFTKSILYDEKIGGTLHMAVGAGYPDTGSKNDSALHWDMICDMTTDSEIRVDGELFYKDGQFVV